ncbi:precorrin-6y C5,15-methyltransferase (decarboxylating) subunit CbiE [Lolliginicoccus suaedae]|uniref:precorrin-6y C5,15-methyltransferase (decarboxylating) subunit CbiE n=1 Tax=Lolliginicoccus suaedae TaxID=2605429 RepID=UPI001F447593|nr:precorrin-6y C5,15-methyltransferase (decarboxylating) subunit CbiE [Lolliginicoccus suaedae]
MTEGTRSGSPRIAVVGIGADGWTGLGDPARDAIRMARTLHGSDRQLELVPDEVPGQRMPWPSPLLPGLPALIEEHGPGGMCVLASGDPMLHGIGATLARIAGIERLRVLPHVSSVSLACARMGWALQDTPVVSGVNRPLAAILREVAPGRRILVLSEDGSTPRQLADLLGAHGWGGSRLTVLEQLGGPRENTVTGHAAGWDVPDGDPLNVVAIECDAGPAQHLGLVPGLPDEVYGDSQLTKQEVRAVTLAALAPAPGEVLWDVGAGTGSIAIEWMRAHPTCRAVAFEQDPARAERLRGNADALGVPSLHAAGPAPGAFTDVPAALAAPDAIMVGGGATVLRLLDACWDRLRPGGRLVVNAVTMESESLVLRWHGAHGGMLRRMQVHRAAPLGAFTAWRPHMPVTQWKGTKP